MSLVKDIIRNKQTANRASKIGSKSQCFEWSVSRTSVCFRFALTPFYARGFEGLSITRHTNVSDSSTRSHAPVYSNSDAVYYRQDTKTHLVDTCSSRCNCLFFFSLYAIELSLKSWTRCPASSSNSHVSKLSGPELKKKSLIRVLALMDARLFPHAYDIDVL